MRKNLLIIALVAFGGLFAQQEAIYTQYFNNMQAVNPAYVGSRGTLTATLLHRSQWTGIEGSPRTQTFTVHTPIFNENFGGGLSIMNDKIGPVSTTILSVDLAGRVKIHQGGYLAGGIKLGYNFFRANLTSVDINDPDDAFTRNVSSNLPNIGAGLYYYTPLYYVGLSSPRLISNKLDPDDPRQNEARERRHYFITGGLRFPLTPQWQLQPSLMINIADGAPNSFNLSAQAIYQDRIWLGGAWRYQESMALIIGYNFTPQWRFMYSYDFITNDLAQYAGGSHEISLTYDLPFRTERIQNPRYF